MSATAGALLIAGSVIFCVGAGVGVPQVFLTPDPQVRAQLLERHARRWRLAQPLYAAGPLIAAGGAGVLAAQQPAALPGTLLLTAATALLIGAIAWSYSCYRRGVRPVDFAAGRLVAWPFVVYVLATVAGLALLGGGLLAGGYPAWLGWLVIGADAVFLAVYASTRDLPPFVFYLLLLVVGVTLIVDTG